MTAQAAEQLAWRAIEAGAYQEALRLLRPLAERNSEYALLTLGWIYETGVTGDSDKNAARLYYEHAASQGSVSAYPALGRLLLGQGEESQARVAFERGAQLNNDECKAALARLNDSHDEKLAEQAIEAGACEEAVRLLRPLAERNSEYALLALGWICETGATGPPDKDAARSYYERAAAQGSACAYHDVGRLLSRRGEASQARAAFVAGAERGNLPCMARAGRMMVEGRGGPADIDAGSAWLEKAAAKGQMLAQRTLLSIESSNATSIPKKLLIWAKIAFLAIKAGREMVKDPSTDKMR